ncbi:MAG: sulfurase [Blastopirellula sp.]|nr:MAG: sulfurase [Blastopirellula sp.]
MTILNPTKIIGNVETILINKDSKDESIETKKIDKVEAEFAGLAGERHSGLTSISDVRYLRQYPSGTEIRNTRQITILSREELTSMAADLDIPELMPEWLGANLVVSGIPELSMLPPSTRLMFESGAALVIDNQNRPCRYPADVIEQKHPSKGGLFVKTAKDRRGLVAWVEREGGITTGDSIAVHLPPKRIYAHG